MDIDWVRMWVPQTPLLDIVVRGTVIYLALFVYLRIMRRESGNLGTADILFIVLIADAVQNGMANEYRSITEALVLVGTLAAWDVLIDWLAYRFPAMEKLLEGRAVLLISDGRILHRQLRREMISRSELDAELRLQGVENIEDVKRCYLENDGQFSVIRHELSAASRHSRMARR